MRQRTRALLRYGLIWGAVGAALAASVSALAQQGVFTVRPRFTQALAWQVVRNGEVTIVDKNGGLNNTATYIGMIPQQKMGIVILSNCGGEPATRIGRQIMLALARSNATASDDGSKGD